MIRFGRCRRFFGALSLLDRSRSGLWIGSLVGMPMQRSGHFELAHGIWAGYCPDELDRKYPSQGQR